MSSESRLLEIPLERGSPIPLHEQMADYLGELLSAGVVPPGSKLPSERTLASFLGVSRGVISRAYERLKDLGLLEKRARSGVYAKASTGAHREPSTRGFVALADCTAEHIKPSPLESLPEGLSVKDLGSTWLESAGSPSFDELEASLKAELRSFLATRSLLASEGEITPVEGVQRGIFLTLWALGARRPSLWVEELTFPAVLEVARALRLRVKRLPMDEERMLEKLSLEAIPGEMVYLIPSIHNPTTRCISPRARLALLELARERELYLIEDDSFGELKFEGHVMPSLRGSSGGDPRVIYLGSFCQAITPGLKLGYVVCERGLAEEISKARLKLGGTGQNTVWAAAKKLLSTGAVDELLSRARRTLSAKLNLLLQALEERGLREKAKRLPLGGVGIFLEDLGIPGSVLSGRLARRGILVRPAKAFHVLGKDLDAIRLNFSSLSAQEIKRLAAELSMALNP